MITLSIFVFQYFDRLKSGSISCLTGCLSHRPLNSGWAKSTSISMQQNYLLRQLGEEYVTIFEFIMMEDWCHRWCIFNWINIGLSHWYKLWWWCCCCCWLNVVNGLSLWHRINKSSHHVFLISYDVQFNLLTSLRWRFFGFGHQWFRVSFIKFRI